MNKYIFSGNLGQDAQVRSLESGVSAISFTVAVTETWKDKQGNKQESTTWVSCTIWRNPGVSTAIAQYLRKGQKVLVEGKPSARAYVAKDGQAACSLEVKVDNVELLGGAQQQQGQPQQQQRSVPAGAPAAVQHFAQATGSQYVPPAGDSDGDLPF